MKSINAKYAVAIYGIREDTYKDTDGNVKTAGLTFGPASGASYISTYLSHVDKNADGILDQENVVTSNNFVARTAEEAAEEGLTYCIHWLTWAQIVEQSAKDPTVFQTCLDCGCTHSVNLSLNSTLFNSDYTYPGMTGDGVSALYDSIKEEWTWWNYSILNEGGWPASRIRATLNGRDSNTVSKRTLAGTDTLKASECLFTSFPTVLQNSIVAKEVVSNTVYDSSDSADLKTTYDKLWLLSVNEFFKYGANTTHNLNFEGTQYSRMITYATSAGLRMLYCETGDVCVTWTRSQATNNMRVVWFVSRYGKADYGLSYKSYAIAPCFCLP